MIRADRCPRCDSPRPSSHPAVQEGGEVQPCPHPWHGGIYSTERCASLTIDESTPSGHTRCLLEAGHEGSHRHQNVERRLDWENVE